MPRALRPTASSPTTRQKGIETMANPPLRARLHWYRLSSAEFALLTAMCEHCSDGATIWAAVPRLAAYSKLSERKVQRAMRELCRRGILSQLAPANAAKRRPTTYRINEAALQDDPRMAPYLTRQEQLPGIWRASVPGEPIPDRDLVSAGHQTGGQSGAHLVSSGHQSGGHETPDSKVFDPRSADSEQDSKIPPTPFLQKGELGIKPGSRAEMRLHELRRSILGDMCAQKAMRKSLDEATFALCRTWGVTTAEVSEHLKACGFEWDRALATERKEGPDPSLACYSCGKFGAFQMGSGPLCANCVGRTRAAG
jgi:Helix-turn-helix domain